ncbi:MAG: hypothetical protein EVB00_00690 [SAR86 cluster bacterium]|uniref:Thioredoxin domain-containing protein n=1 Tax=SAR86 cluster bacterium TaxID=2030880 RepID=A0A520MBV8_9GAMM|nr:MAG: hypothetical protein EVB00_00690 [SAR86 cluster bacterium]
MRNKIALAFILLTPILVVLFSSLYFVMGYSPEGTKNEGVFFKEYFNVSELEVYQDDKLISFDDGKWVLGIYITDTAKANKSLYLMRQLNIALNRDIFKIKRAVFFNDTALDAALSEIINEYPRIEVYKDSTNNFFQKLQENSAVDLVAENPIFVIDPYGRVVMYFDTDLNPKKMLKDLKVLI